MVSLQVDGTLPHRFSHHHQARAAFTSYCFSHPCCKAFGGGRSGADLHNGWLRMHRKLAMQGSRQPVLSAAETQIEVLWSILSGKVQAGDVLISLFN